MGDQSLPTARANRMLEKVWRYLFGARSRMFGGPRGRAFVSYAYDDEDRLNALGACVPPDTILAPFPPIDARPDQMVSEHLIREIRASDCLIYVDTRHSRQSRWVTMEVDYARRNHLPVFRYSVEGTLSLDAQAPMHLPVFPSYSHQDDSRGTEDSQIHA